LDRIDLAILEAMQVDAGMTNQAIGELVGLTPGPTHSRIKRLKEEGYIKGIHAELDWKALGLSYFSIVDVKVSESKAQEAEAWMVQVPGIWNLSRLKNPGMKGEVVFRFWGMASKREVSLQVVDSLLQEFDSHVDIQMQEVELVERRSVPVQLGQTLLGDDAPSIWSPKKSSKRS